MASSNPNDDHGDPAWSMRWFVPMALGILLVAAALRLPELALNPFHHDEGVNGWFLTGLLRNGVWAYDPANYHGPSLYFLSLIPAILLGLTTEALRLVPVTFGLLTVGLVFTLRRPLGPLPVLVAGALLAVSPGAIYMSRYFIHEALVVAFTLALVTSAWAYLEWRRPWQVIAAAASAALLFATKETGIVTVVVLGIAAVASGIYVDLRDPAGRRARARARGAAARPRAPRESARAARPKSVWIDGVEYRATGPVPAARAASRSTDRDGIPMDHLAAAVVVFLVIYVLLFTSFFTNFPRGLIDSIATFTVWTHTSGATQTQPFTAYLEWMLRADTVILLAGTIGGLVTAVRATDRRWVFVGLWALGITLAYSLVAYKTPWIALNMLLPLALLGGLAFRTGWSMVRWRPVVAIVAAGALAWSTYMAVDLNYVHYDDERYPYVFVHTTREALDLVAAAEDVASRAGTGTETGIVVMSPDHWPLPWYFRDYPRAGFYGQIVDTEEAVIIANENQLEELVPRVGDRYRETGRFTLRPGVRLVLFVRSDLAAAGS